MTKLRATARQLKDFGDHIASCIDCRATVVAAWSVSLDITDSIADLCLEGLILLGCKLLAEAPGAGAGTS